MAAERGLKSDRPWRPFLSERSAPFRRVKVRYLTARGSGKVQDPSRISARGR
jgi:hypothetical protein